MPQHEYTAKEALRLLLEKIAAKDAALAARIQIAIDSGKQVLKKVEEPSDSGRGRKRKRQYWVTVPYSDEEALQVALTVLESHLVENRMMLNRAFSDFEKAGEGSPKPIKRSTTLDSAGFALEPALEFEPTAVPRVENAGSPKTLRVESEPVQQQEKHNAPDYDLTFTPSGELESLQAVFGKLESLLDFNGGKDGNSP